MARQVNSPFDWTCALMDPKVMSPTSMSGGGNGYKKTPFIFILPRWILSLWFTTLKDTC